ncbi:MAG: MBL fold metallo-hydrolase [Candidatus Eisenbacteria bacterium]|nr:MBL fold metallo-hydrolase [Candidatus Eisenbacteria bacterium]
MTLTWLGHASFLIESGDGTKLVTDPYESGSYDGAVGYSPISESADIVTVSHDHADHNAVDTVSGDPEVVRGAEPRTVKGVSIRGIETYHDTSKGQDRGRNTIFVMEVDGVRIGHLGDLGHTLSDDEVESLGEIDVLLTPVGGYYTIGPEEAKAVAERVGAKIIIPMHYKTDALGFPIQPVDDFLKLMENVERRDSNSIEINSGELSGPGKVVVLDYE